MGRLLGTLNGPLRHSGDPVRIAFEGGFREDALDLSGVHVLAQTRQMRGLDSVDGIRRRHTETREYLRAATDPLGDAAFHVTLHDFLMPEKLFDQPRLAAATAAGGRGAVYLALEMLRQLHPEATLWLPEPGRGWQHRLAAVLGLNLRHYPYSDGQTLLREEMLAVLSAAAPGDMLLLQACGHDPTGIDLPQDMWSMLTALCIETGAIPLIDLSFAGLAGTPKQGIDGPQGMMLALPEAFLAISCSWSFALHADRTALLLVQAETPEEALIARDMLAGLSETLMGAPPRPGELIVTDLLCSPQFRPGWEAELRQLRMELGETRAKLAEALSAATGTGWEGLASGSGLFAQLPLRALRRHRMWTGHGIMIGRNGRINLSGLDATAISRIAAAVADCLAAPEEELEPELAELEAYHARSLAEAEAGIAGVAEGQANTEDAPAEDPAGELEDAAGKAEGSAEDEDPAPKSAWSRIQFSFGRKGRARRA